MSTQAVIIRADADVAMGTGHVMRCIALAQELLLRDYEVHWVIASPPPFITQRLEEEGCRVHCLTVDHGTVEDTLETIRLADAVLAGWVILDGYQFDAEYQQGISGAGLQLLCIDDYGHADQYVADIILNQNIYARDIQYPQAPVRQFLHGPRYALIRKEILSKKGMKKPFPAAPFNILVTLGGSDPENVTLQVLNALQELPEDSFSAKVILGGSNSHHKSIAACAGKTRHAVEILTNVRDMGGLYAWADLAISSAGSTMLELACFAIPAITVVIAYNQERVGKSLAQNGAAVNLGYPGPSLEKRVLAATTKIMKSRALRDRLSRNVGTLVDGKGAARVCDCIKKSTILLKKAQASDCQTVYSWINDPGVRAVSFSKKPILWDEHIVWFLEKISDPDTLYYLIWTGDLIPAGQVRYDLDKTEATISILVDPHFRNRNIGVLAMRRSARLLFARTRVEKIHAYIKPSNEISCKAFSRAGYKYHGTVTKDTDRARHMILTRGTNR